MNVLILGCSFGVPNYFGPPMPGPDTHTEFLLRKHGHTVFNCAKNGGSNLDSLERAKSFLHGIPITHPAFKDQSVKTTAGQKIDWIVWFHTELYRDLQKLPNKTNLFTQDRSAIAKLTYQSYKEFQDQTSAKLAVIGGAGELDDCFSDYLLPEFTIRSWRSEILGIDTLSSHTLWQREYFNHSKDTVKEKLQRLENDLYLLDLTHASADFPDDYHPGERPHRELAEKLHKLFQL